MSNKKMLMAAAWLETWSTYTGAFALGDGNGINGIDSATDTEDEHFGNGKGKGKGMVKSRDQGPSFNPDFVEPPPARPGRVDAPIDGTINNGKKEAKGGPWGTEAVTAEEPPPPPPPENPQEQPLKEPPQQEPPPEEFPPPPPPPPPPPENAARATPTITRFEIRPSSTSSSFVPVLSTSRPAASFVSSSSTQSLSRETLPATTRLPPRPSSAPVFPVPRFPQSQPKPQPPRSSQPPRPPPQNSAAPRPSAPAVIPAVPSPPRPPPQPPASTTNPPVQTLPSAQTTDAGSPPPVSPAPAAPSSTPLTDQQGVMPGNNSQGFESDRSLVIALSTVLSLLGVAVIVLTICLCYRYRYGRLPLANRWSRRGPFTQRGITPIDDEEIESWKANRSIEKSTTIIIDKHESVPAVRKPPSVIVYQNPNSYPSRVSSEVSPRTLHHKRSMDNKKSLEVPNTPVLARAPNARVGLTDDTVEGDLAFLPSPKRQNSRLSKLPPMSPRQGRHRSYRSSASVGSLRDHWFGYHTDIEFSPRTSTDPSPHMPSSAHSDGRHQGIYSDSSNPPRLSLDEEYRIGGLSPRPRPRSSEIGLAVG